MPQVRSSTLGPATRPVALPRDLAAMALPKHFDVVELPSHIAWSGRSRKWDMRDASQRARVYEIVLTEGTEEDVLGIVQLDELIRLWPTLFLSPHVRSAWAEHLHSHGVIEVRC